MTTFTRRTTGTPTSRTTVALSSPGFPNAYVVKGYTHAWVELGPLDLGAPASAVEWLRALADAIEEAAR